MKSIAKIKKLREAVCCQKQYKSARVSLFRNSVSVYALNVPVGYVQRG